MARPPVTIATMAGTAVLFSSAGVAMLLSAPSASTSAPAPPAAPLAPVPKLASMTRPAAVTEPAVVTEPAAAPAPEAPPAPSATIEPALAPEETATPEQLYAALAEAAAATCPGLPPGVLYAIAETETRHGRTTAVSSAGAVGPMQFMPATWYAYAIDADGDGWGDVENPADAVYGAASYLCSNGGWDPNQLRTAIWNYNHSNAYVEQVLRIAEAYAAVNDAVAAEAAPVQTP